MVAISADLVMLASALQSPSGQMRAFAATGAREAGCLRLVPAMLQAWRIADHHQDRTTIPTSWGGDSLVTKDSPKGASSSSLITITGR